MAVWKVKRGLRFQNFRAIFTILDAGTITRGWLSDLIAGNGDILNAPSAWLQWITSGTYHGLLSERSIEHRTRPEQTPPDEAGKRIISAIHGYFVDHPHAFERCAASLAKLVLPDVAQLDVTRPSRDGGRDAIGKVRLGTGPGAIMIDFALEAKCYQPANSVGVRELSPHFTLAAPPVRRPGHDELR